MYMSCTSIGIAGWERRNKASTDEIGFMNEDESKT